MASSYRRPDYGRRLLSTIIDERARDNHERPYASIPLSSDAKQGFRDVTYRVFANAINRCAVWLTGQVGTSTSFENLVYIGPSDLRYQILCMATVKTGHVMFFVSARNSMEAHLSLLNEAAVSKIIIPKEEPPIVTSILKKRPMQVLNIPDLEDLLEESPVEPLPFEKGFDEYRMKPWLLLHTSGSTGIPKVITIRHGYACTMDAYHRFGHEIAHRCGSMRIFNPFPPFHMAGIMWSLPIVCWIDSTIVLPPTQPLTADLANSVHESGNIEYSCLPPSIVTELAKNETYLRTIGKLRGLGFAGGPLPQATGDKIFKYTQMYTSYGSTEMFAPPLLPKRPEHWPYHSFNTEQSGIEFREADGGLYELVIVRDEKLDLVQAIFVTFPDLQEYHSKDLFSKHPSVDGLWTYAGRLDDIIVFSNGEKLNPVSMESTITACPEVTGCLVVGQGRFQSALLLETRTPPTSESDKERLTQAVWPFVKRANESCIAHGKVSKDLVIFTSAKKPFLRAGKGTVQRQRSVALYENEIEELYQSLDGSEKPRTARLDLTNLETTEMSLQDHVANESGLGELALDEDFFKAGMDSLQLISLVRAINASTEVGQIEPKQIYDNPTIEQLATALQSPAPPIRDDDDDIETWVLMQQMFKDATGTLPKPPHQVPFHEKSKPKNFLSQSVTGEQPASNFNQRSVFPVQGSKRLKEADWTAFAEDYNASTDKEFLISMVPPDGGITAWLQVLASFLINLNNWGLINSFGAYQAFYESNFLSHKSPSTIAWIGTVQAGLLLIIGVFSGPLFDKGYFRITLICAGATLVFALMMLSLSTMYYQIMLSQGLLIGCCCGLLYIPSVALMPLYFKDRRGLALGLATSGASVGGIIYPIIFRRLLDAHGFPWATRIIAFIALITLAVATVIIRPMDQMKRPAREIFEISAIQEFPFASFMVSAFLLFLAFLVPFFLTSTFAVTELGTSKDTAFYLLAVINAAQFFGRTIPASLSDHFGGEVMLFAAEIFAAILGFCWIAVHNLGGFIAFLVLYGFASGMMATLPAVVVPYVCPSLNVIGTRMGMVYASAGVGALFGVPIATGAANASGNYLGAQLWMGLCCLVASGFFAITGSAAWKQRRAIDMPRKSHA